MRIILMINLVGGKMDNIQIFSLNLTISKSVGGIF